MAGVRCAAAWGGAQGTAHGSGQRAREGMGIGGWGGRGVALEPVWWHWHNDGALGVGGTRHV